MRCFNPKVCKEDSTFIIAEIPGKTGKIVINKRKLLKSLQESFPTDKISEQSFESEEEDEPIEPVKEEHNQPPQEDHNHKDLVSMDWDSIKEKHKEENRDDFNK